LLLLVLEPAADLLVPLAVYAVVLTAMALLASGLGPLATAGGLVFLLSDSLLALRVFAYPSVPTLGVWIMLTYVLGQALIVLGALDQARARPSSPPLVGVNP
ncbi:MAG TPA: lysoplasmalogenase family protein, partial [Propionibacteriaceae bacterium]|nr:lysoplasmalogenase family protein [Propionibacteriaceae bacterium]